MKKIVLCLFVSIVWLNLFADGVEPNGTGSMNDPYQVEILDNLLWMSTNSCDGFSFIQIADIDASDTFNWNGGQGMIPITLVNGYYDGDGYTIDQVTISRGTINGVGFFVDAISSVIQNVNLSNLYIVGWDYTGGLVGVSNNTTITNCHVSGSVIGQNNTGGIVAHFHTNSSIFDSSFDGDVSGHYAAGGIVGFSHSGLISNCSSAGNVSGENWVGGISGWNYATLENCYSTSDVDGYLRVGGFVGDTSWNTISNCYSSGDVSGFTKVGGFVGESGSSSIIQNCFSACDVDGTENVGGFAGVDTGDITNCFWDTDTSGQTTSAGGTGKTTSEMQDVATYTSLATVGLDEAWDFVGNPFDDTGNEDYWDINASNNDGYPYLSWQSFLGFPSNVTAEVYDVVNVLVSWDAPAGNVLSFNVYRNGTNIGNTTDTTYDDLGLNPGMYEYGVSAVYDEGESMIVFADIVTIENNVYDPPLNVEIDAETQILTWEAPATGGEGEWIGWDNGTNSGSMGLSGGGTFYAASRWEPNDLYAYNGFELSKIVFFVSSGANSSFTLKIWTGPDAGTEILSHEVTNFTIGAFNEVVLDTPITIDATQELWFGYEVTHDNNESPAGTDAGPAVAGYGDMFSLNSTDWITLSGISFNVNWNLQAFVEDGDGREVVLSHDKNKKTQAVKVNRNSDLISVIRTQNTVVEHNRDLLGYNIYLDGDLIAENIPDLFYAYDDLDPGQEYTAGVSAVYDDPGESEIIEVVFTMPTEGDDIILAATRLGNNYPNPFNPVTNIAYSIKKAGNVTIEVYNLKGQFVKTLVNETKETGEYSAIWNGRDNSNKSVASGIYFYKLKTGEIEQTKKMILMK